MINDAEQGRPCPVIASSAAELMIGRTGAQLVTDEMVEFVGEITG